MATLFDDGPGPLTIPRGPRLAAADMFAPGSAWVMRMEEWVAENFAPGTRVEATCIDQTFRVNGVWYVIEKNEETEEWEVDALLTGRVNRPTPSTPAHDLMNRAKQERSK